jgi:hypothetical protein
MKDEMASVPIVASVSSSIHREQDVLVDMTVNPPTNKRSHQSCSSPQTRWTHRQ